MSSAGVLDARISPDPWLTGLLERPVWNVRFDGTGESPLSALRADSGARCFATAKVPAADTRLAGELQAFGFRVVDTALTLETPLVSATDQSTARFAVPTDRAAVEAIAASAFRYSRFHLDPQVPAALAHEVKRAWAANWFCGARGDGMIVAEHPAGSVAGFLQLLWHGDQLVIDLIAVLPASGRRGLARAMIAFAYRHGTGNGRRPRGMIVGTQAANVPSMRLYESVGFRLSDAKFVLHFHGGAR